MGSGNPCITFLRPQQQVLRTARIRCLSILGLRPSLVFILVYLVRNCSVPEQLFENPCKSASPMDFRTPASSSYVLSSKCFGLFAVTFVLNLKLTWTLIQGCFTVQLSKNELPTSRLSTLLIACSLATASIEYHRLFSLSTIFFKFVKFNFFCKQSTNCIVISKTITLLSPKGLPALPP